MMLAASWLAGPSAGSAHGQEDDEEHEDEAEEEVYLVRHGARHEMNEWTRRGSTPSRAGGAAADELQVERAFAPAAIPPPPPELAPPLPIFAPASVVCT